ncbi:WXG100 family type VII secretion target [Glycomyces harbinensis]|uniref:Proteins of 100 residues with WXG n=1 Tax=Glycomyces harbinensis TaxID=58114 RepID=A0A1G6WRT5_9ACTN|nr:hypothetical protein [Glycomyces harbinensis]SDD67755.1 hypothetical protein SAMN05216270_106147 [Glycomyces harbinensis]
MPSYDEALAANPAGFVDYAAEMTSAGTDLTDHQGEYDAVVTTINADWQDEANAAFNEDVDTVGAHVGDVVSQVDQAAELLSTGGGHMVSQVEQLRATDAAYRGAGFDVQSEPRVELGAVHWAAIAAAGPFGPVLRALFQARADEGTTQLQLGLAVLTATDVATGAGLTAAAEQLEPLEDKGGPGNTVCPPAVDEKPDRNESNTKDENGTAKKTGGDEKDGKDGKDENKEGNKDEKDEKDGEKDEKPKEEDPADPDRQDQAPRNPEAEQPRNETPGMVEPDPGPADVPGYESPELSAPEIPDYESDWDPSELGGAELPTGGLAGGGGIGSGGGLSGGGTGAPDLPLGAPGGASGGVFAAPGAGAAPVGATGAGARTGAGGFMGAPGARGANVADDEVERESFLLEDPDEDVWGIGTDKDNPYVDYQGERPGESGPPPLDEIPPFTLPGFDLPSDQNPR